VAEITLRVTKRELAHATGLRQKERQIAYSGASPDIAPKLAEITAKHPVTLRLGGLITLDVADRNAIWRVHNEKHAADFDALFKFLAQYPSKPMRFLCEIVG
jgi:hypothetical protein